MPYAHNSDLPEQVRDALPEAAQTRFRTVVNGALERGLDDAKAFGSGWAVIRNGWEKPKDGGKWVHKAAAARTLFASRPVENGQELVDWAKAQGFPTTLDADAMHVTQAYSKEPLEWPEPRDDTVLVRDTAGRKVGPLGDQGAMVLHFESPSLQARHEKLKALGAKSDYPSFTPHVTISWKADDVDHTKVVPYDGPLVLGPERFREIDPDFDPAKITEKYNENHDALGRFSSGGDGGGGNTIEADIPGAYEGGGGGKSYGLVPGDVEKFHALKSEWAKVNNDLLTHIDRPDSPEAQAAMREMERISKEIGQLHCDPGGPEGIGLPGGPRDVVVVGAGPGGLTASIFGGAEGLDTLVIEKNVEAGGQARYSSRIENYPGFPVGVTGETLTQNMFEQSERLGAANMLGVSVTGISYDPDTGMKTLTLSDGTTVESRTVILAGGVEFRQPDFEGAQGPGVYVGDGKALTEHAAGGAAVVVGGSNGAAQAALGAATEADHVYLISRSPIANGMSDYQVSALANQPKVTVIEGDTIVKLNRDAAGNPVSVETKSGQTVECNAVGMFTGSVPVTDWLAGKVDRDASGRVSTSRHLETNMPGVFAVGDMREGAIGRIGVAVGEGQLALREAHIYLEDSKKAKAKLDAAITQERDTTKAVGQVFNASDLLTRLFAIDRHNPWFGQTVEDVMPVQKANPYHDEQGRFSSGGGGGGGGVHDEQGRFRIPDEAIRQAGNGIGMVAGAAVSAALRQFSPGKVPSSDSLSTTISRIAARAKVSGGVIRDALRRGFKAALTMSEGEARTLESTLSAAKADNKAWLQDMIAALDAYEDVDKAGARHNASDRKMVQEMHDHAVKLGADCTGDYKHEKADDRYEKFNVSTIDQNGEVTLASVIKVDESLGLVFGWAMICKEGGEEYFDVQDDHIPEDAMLKASTDFMLSRRVAKEMHFGDETGTIVFAFPVTEDVAKAMDITTKRSGLMIAMKPSSEALLEKFRSGEYTGFSIGGQRLVDEEMMAA